jgi:hypothetical protein
MFSNNNFLMNVQTLTLPRRTIGTGVAFGAGASKAFNSFNVCHCPDHHYQYVSILSGSPYLPHKTTET